MPSCDMDTVSTIVDRLTGARHRHCEIAIEFIGIPLGADRSTYCAYDQADGVTVTFIVMSRARLYRDQDQ